MSGAARLLIECTDGMTGGLTVSHNIKYRQLKAFRILAESGSFKHAADSLAVTQPSMSIMIRELESDLGVALIDRATRSAELTDAGRDFYQQIKGSLDQLEKAYSYANAAGKAEHGRVRIATLTSLAAEAVTTAIARMHAERPGIQIELMERTYFNFLLALRRREVDLGVGILHEAHADLDFQYLFSDQLVVVTPKGHPLARQRQPLRHLGKYDVVVVSPGPSLEALQELDADCAPPVQVEQPSTAITMVRKGLGVTVTSSSATTGLDMRGLAAVPIPGTTRDVGVITLAQARLSPVASAFLRCLRHVHPAG